MAKKKFEDMTTAEQRVQIALDVLSRLKSRKISAKTGTWVDVDAEYSNPDNELNKELKGKKCSACALGAMFVCAVDRLDQLKIKDLHEYQGRYSTSPTVGGGEISISFSDIEDYLLSFFDKRQMMLIENAFETGAGYYDRDGWGSSTKFQAVSVRTWNKSSDFCKGKTPIHRMRAIMENIVENDGNFAP